MEASVHPTMNKINETATPKKYIIPAKLDICILDEILVTVTVVTVTKLIIRLQYVQASIKSYNEENLVPRSL